MAEHTPTPWRFDGDWYRIPTIFGADGKTVASVEKDARESTPERAANAAFIVKAVNNHDALVKALRDVMDAANDPYEVARNALSRLNAPVGSSGSCGDAG